MGDWGGRDYGHVAQKRKLDHDLAQATADIRSRDDAILALNIRVGELEAQIKVLKGAKKAPRKKSGQGA